jgi:hypothetical protein
MKKAHKHKKLGGGMPFPGHEPVMKGEPATHLKPGKMHSKKKGGVHVSAKTTTGHVKGPLTVKGKHSKGKRTSTKA